MIHDRETDLLLSPMTSDRIPTNTRHFPNVVLMLARRLRCRPNIKTTLGKCLVFVGSQFNRVRCVRAVRDCFSACRHLSHSRMKNNYQRWDAGIVWHFLEIACERNEKFLFYVTHQRQNNLSSLCWPTVQHRYKASYIIVTMFVRLFKSHFSHIPFYKTILWSTYLY